MTRARPLPFPLAAGLVIALWAPYTALNTVFPGPVLTYALGLTLAGLALGALLLAGMGAAALYLRVAPPSVAGVIVLAALSLFVPIALLAGRGQPWNLLDDLVYAPASGIAQELYFRSALLPVLARLCGPRSRAALSLQALLFALWHVRAFRVAPVAPAIGVLAVTFVGGLCWGWQARRDRTIIYVAAQHALFLVVQ